MFTGSVKSIEATTQIFFGLKGTNTGKNTLWMSVILDHKGVSFISMSSKLSDLFTFLVYHKIGCLSHEILKTVIRV